MQDMKAHMTRFESACREQGLKITHQRVEVFRAIYKAKDHPSVEEIYDVVHRRIPSISLDTVYRTVDTFEKLGLVSRFQAPDGRYRFDTNVDLHQHLVCASCGRIEDIHWEGLESLRVPSVPGWSDLHLSSVEIRGLCETCRRKN
jgi:Fur family peroxide stress response transcriptional regulator